MCEVDYDLRRFGGSAVISEIKGSNQLQIRSRFHSTAHFGTHPAVGSEDANPFHHNSVLPPGQDWLDSPGRHPGSSDGKRWRMGEQNLRLGAYLLSGHLIKTTQHLAKSPI